MDFGNAAMLIASVFGLTELAKRLLPGKLVANSKVVVIVVIVAAFVAVFVLGGTVWAHEQVIGNHNLDNLGVDDKIVVAFFLAGATVFGNEFFVKSIRNIGQNQPDAQELKKAA